ncbi:MAG: cytidylyltransferase domain-containing protein, partial [Thermoanaerobaculum sp.]
MTARRALAVIPARMGATRFPGKPLVPLLGKPMVAHVVSRALDARVFAEVIVATDHEDVARV